MSVFHIFTEMPGGMQSRGYIFPDEEKAKKAFDEVKRQLLQFNLQDENFECSAIMQEDSEEVERFHVARFQRQ